MPDESDIRFTSVDSQLYLFSDEKYIAEKPEAFDQKLIALMRKVPTVDNIVIFMKTLFECAHFSPECSFIWLIYIYRLIAHTCQPLNPTNWRTFLLVSLLVSQKVWDDRYLSNSDLVYIYPFFTLSEINKLEEKFLELIHFNLTIKSSLYTRYYIEMLALHKDNTSEFPLGILDQNRAEELEAQSGFLGIIEKTKSERLSKMQNTYLEFEKGNS